MSQKHPAGGIADQIITDLINLGVDAKRKNPEVRYACDHSIELMKPFSSSSNGQSTKTADMEDTITNHPEFISPLIMACHSKNPKLIADAIKTLSKIIKLKLLPKKDSTPADSPDPIANVVEGLNEASNTGEDIQVKLLQLLPSFCQLYAFRINDEILSRLLFICSNLQGANKTPVIVNTAQATFSQLLDIAFDKIDSKASDAEILDKKYEVTIDNDEVTKIDQYLYDAKRIVADLCTLIEHHKPVFLKTNYMSEDYGFEVLESLIKNNSQKFLDHPELAFLLRTRVVPLLLRFLSSSKDFTLMVKVSRLIFLLLNNVFDVLKLESEVTLSLLIHITSKESGSPYWKKIMGLEIFTSIFRNPELVMKLFREYDNNPKEERKNIIHDFLNICFVIVTAQKHVLNTGDLVQPPPAQLDNLATPSKQQHQKKAVHSVGLRVTDFSKVVRFIDSIDKQDPPPIPDSYNLYLILQILVSLSDCIQNCTLQLMKSTDPEVYIDREYFDKSNNEELKKQFNEIFDLIGATWHLQLSITAIFVHSTLDNELFSNCLKLLENLCYCSGILSIDTVKSPLLKYIGVCALKLDGTFGYKSRVMSIGESIVGTISLTLGNAVSNISNGNTIENENTNVIKLYPRTINTRQTLCFHTLSRLAVSLGAHLFEDWKIILSVMQWISYYIDGPTNYNKKDVPPISQFLSNRDLQIIEHSLTELNKSIFNQDEKTFNNLLKMAIALSDEIMNIQNKEGFGQSPINDKDEIQPCAFNKLYYINKITDIATVNPKKFLIIPEYNINELRSYFSNIVNDRSSSDEIRLFGTRCFNQIERSAAESGFDNEETETHLLTEKRVLNSLCDYMGKLSELPLSKELLIANCEAEIYLQCLETLKSIIDRYGSLIQQSWNTVTQMINFPFMIIQNYDTEIIGEKSISENIVSLLKSSFETLKVILDEMLQCIPKNQIQVIIDSLYHFVEQNFDINISFNSVSYFWLISDHIKEKIELDDNKNIVSFNIKSENELTNAVVDGLDNDYQYYQYLWIYLVLQLTKTVSDNRAQVRNGSIITIFNVIKSFSLDGQLLSLLYDIVLEPFLLHKSSFESLNSLEGQDLKDWMESFINITNGITKLLLGQINVINHSNIADVQKFWNGIMKFFVELVNLDYNWVDLNDQIFKNYKEILTAFSICEQALSDDLLELLFEPWSSIKINYNFINPSLYQKSLCSLVDCFSISVTLFKPMMTTFKIERMLTILNSCIRYPILADSRADDKKCTVLQQAVLDNISELKFDKNDKYYLAYESLIIQQLNLIIVLPFHTRELIVKKLGDRGVKIPTFIAASYYGMNLLSEHLNNIEDLTYLNDRSILKVTKSLLEPTKAKHIKAVDSSKNEVFLWIISFQILVTNITKILNFILEIPDYDFSNKVNSDSLNKLLPYYMQAFDSCFDSVETLEEQKIIFSECKVLKTVLLEFFNSFYESDKKFNVETQIIEQFISTIWNSSFFYEHDSLMESIIPIGKLNGQLMNNFVDTLSDESIWNVYGTTESIRVFRNLKLAQECFNDLVILSNFNNYKHISETCLPFFIARCVYGLRKYIMDAKLLGSKPIPRIQLIELKAITQGLQKILIDLESFNEANLAFIYPMLKNFRPLMIQLLPKIPTKDIQQDLTEVCLRLCR